MSERETFGEGCFKRIPEALHDLNAKKILLVTGNRSYVASGAEQRLDDFRSQFSFSRIRVTSEYPDLEFIKSSIEHFRNFTPDAVLAIGGGNVLDTAKAVNFLAVREKSPDDILNGAEEISAKECPLIAVPTTAGSGSEATHFAVVYSGDKKFSLADKSILPFRSYIDPELTYSLNKYQTAVSGIDAFCQSVESVWACGSNEESVSFALDAIELITKSFLKCVNAPDSESRRDMSRAANLAGRAINISKTTAPHALSYTMTKKFEVPHGQAVCVTLGEFLEFNYAVGETDCNDVRGHKHVRDSINKIVKALSAGSPADAKVKITELIKAACLKTRLNELGIDDQDKLDEIAGNVNTERLGNNPRKLSGDVIKEILTNVS